MIKMLSFLGNIYFLMIGRGTINKWFTALFEAILTYVTSILNLKKKGDS